MTTCNDLIKAAYRKLRVTSFERGEAMTAAQAEIGLETLNRMMASLKARGADTGWVPLTLFDTFPLPAEHESAVVARLALALASEVGYELPPDVAVAAQDGLDVLRAAYGRVRELGMPLGIQGRRRSGRFNIETGGFD